MVSKQDYLIAGFVGFITGVFAVPLLVNLGIKNQALLIALPLAAAILFALGMVIAGKLSRWFAFVAQFSKFVAVGLSNTAIDFGVLNLLSFITGITGGYIIGGVNIPGFSVAVLNSYLWNKFWVFHADGQNGKQRAILEIPKFLVISVLGLFLNSLIVVLVTTYIGPAFALRGVFALNIGKAVGSVAVLLWNFFGYKFIVFAKNRYESGTSFKQNNAA